MRMDLPIVTLPTQATVRVGCGGFLNSAVIQNRQTAATGYVEVWFSDEQPDPTNTADRWYFRIPANAALTIDPSDTSTESSQNKICTKNFWIRGNVTDVVAYADVLFTTKYEAYQANYGVTHQVQV